MEIPYRFISFEGVDGAGKTSHIDWLADHLTARGEAVVRTREPGGTPLGETLRSLLLSEQMDSTTELMLMYAARRQHLVQLIEPALASGKIVITDRFEDSTYAYQGGGRELPFDVIDKLSHCCSGARPDLTFYFDLPVDTAAQRLTGTRDLDRFEVEDRKFHEAVRQVYRQRALEEPGRVRIIDATRPIEEIRKQLSDLLVMDADATSSTVIGCGSHDDRVEAIMGDPATSVWLKSSLASAVQRDPVDALNDAEALAEALKARLNALLSSLSN